MKKFTQRLIKGFLIFLIAMTAFGAHLQIPQNDLQARSDAPASISLSWGTEALAIEKVDKKKDGDEVKQPFDAEEFIKSVAKTVVYVHRVFYPMNHFFAFQIGNFLGTDYIFEGKMGTMLKAIWVITRNIVNVVFVLILLFLAIRYILPGGKDEGGGLRQQLGKFAILLIAVNFSWLASKVVLDAANVATNVVFSIPSAAGAVSGDALLKECDVTKDENGQDITTGLCYPTAIFAPADSEQTIYWKDSDCKDIRIADDYKAVYDDKGNLNPNATPDQKLFVEKTTTMCWDTLDLSKFRQQTSTIFLTYGTARIQNLIRSNSPEPENLAVGTFFSLVLQIAYFLTLVALFFALVIRMAVLWLFVAFSPVLVLIFYLSDFGVKEIPQFSIQEFIRWAFVPAMVGAVFSVSFLMISAGQSIAHFDPAQLDTIGKYSSITAKIFKAETLFSGMDSLWDFIWLLMTVGILWIGTFTILSKFDFIKPVTDKINTMGSAAAKTIGTAPYWAPIIPMYNPKTQKWSMTSAKAEGEKYGFRAKEWKKMSSTEKVKKTMEHLKKGNAQAIAGNYGLTIEAALKNPDQFKDKMRADGLRDESKLNEIIQLLGKNKPTTAPAPKFAAAPEAPKEEGDKKGGGEGGNEGGGGE